MRRVYLVTDVTDKAWDGMPVYVLRRKAGAGNAEVEVATVVDEHITKFVKPTQLDKAPEGLQNAIDELIRRSE